MSDFKSGDTFEINDGFNPAQVVTVLHNYGSKVVTETRITEGYKEYSRKGETHQDTFQQLIDNRYLQKL